MGNATITWQVNPAADGVTNYRVWRSLGGGSFVALATLGAVTTYTDTTVPNVTQAIAYNLTALDASGNESAHGNTISRMVDVTPPSAPVILDVVLG